MAETGLLGMVLGGVAYLASFENMIKVEAALGVEADAVRRLGALGVWVEEDAERLTQRLRLSNAESERLIGAGRLVAGGAGGRMAERRAALLYRLGPQSFCRSGVRCLGALGCGRGRRRLARLASLPQRWTAPVFPLKAADFMRPRVAAGPPLGAAMRAAEAAWIAADFPADRAAMETIAKQAAQHVRSH